MGQTRSDDDQTGDVGWSIGDAWQNKTGTGAWTESTEGKTLRMSVHGVARPPILLDTTGAYANTTPQQPQPPPAPTELTATVNTDGHIVLDWDAPADDTVTGYVILRRRPSEGENTLSVYVEDTASTDTAYTDTDVTAGVQHVYRVKAINAAGESRWSNYVNSTPPR